jgi:hypothetical protein
VQERVYSQSQRTLQRKDATATSLMHVLNLEVMDPENGANDSATNRSDLRMQLFIFKVHFLMS